MKNVKNGNSSNKECTMIPSCNNHFAEVKFRPKTTHLETIFNTFREEKLFRANCTGGNYEGQFSAG